MGNRYNCPGVIMNVSSLVTMLKYHSEPTQYILWSSMILFTLCRKGLKPPIKEVFFHLTTSLMGPGATLVGRLFVQSFISMITKTIPRTNLTISFEYPFIYIAVSCFEILRIISWVNFNLSNHLIALLRKCHGSQNECPLRYYENN